MPTQHHRMNCRNLPFHCSSWSSHIVLPWLLLGSRSPFIHYTSSSSVCSDLPQLLRYQLNVTFLWRSPWLPFYSKAIPCQFYLVMVLNTHVLTLFSSLLSSFHFCFISQNKFCGRRDLFCLLLHCNANTIVSGILCRSLICICWVNNWMNEPLT